MRWAIELSEFDVQYEPRGPMKGQVYVDLVVELVEPSGVQDLKNPNPLKDVEASAVLDVAVLV